VTYGEPVDLSGTDRRAHLRALLAARTLAERPLADIVAERVRQDAKFGGRRDYDDGTGSPNARAAADLLREVCKAAPDDGDTWADILAEEVAEAFAETGGDRAALRRELIQVAAVCVAWAEALDRRAS